VRARREKSEGEPGFATIHNNSRLSIGLSVIFKEFDGSVKNLQVHNNWGSVLQGGAEYELNSKCTLFIDFKEVWLAVNAHGVLSDGTAVKARVKLNPSLVTVGIKFHLPFSRGH